MRSPLVAALLFALLLPSCSGGKNGGPTAPTSDGGGSTAPEGGGAASSGGGTSKGNAPDFTLPTLDGKNVSLSDYAGKSVVLIDFWATTCDPCLVEMPHIVALYEKYKAQGFVVLAVSLDGPETRSQVSSIVHDKKMTFPVLLDEETSVVARYNPKKDMPFSVLIDKNGSIVKKMSGYNPGDEEKLAAEVEKLLK
ncbi:MAG: TlpA family protein disulfide reductase [Polyangiaceae bacterium]|nr:TlpA family protein disulfide reductase [Polyangiaceae bacterium]